MIRTDEAKWIEQGTLLVAKGPAGTYELNQFAVSMLNYFYGPDSPQMQSFVRVCQAASHDKTWGLTQMLYSHAAGVVKSTIRELQNGLIGNLRTTIQGELLGDFLSLAKESLSQSTQESKNVAAVLTAAAFEDCLRRLAAEKAGITTRPKLEVVLGSLKAAGILKGGNLSLANSLLKFRNDSLHADWSQVQQAQVESCLALTESLLRDYFS